ncbi:MAG: ACT domain-containing protein [Anaerofustis stercorihominis]|nr:ACT domain-containing protein [Anaerofustis stercorihominis]
MKAVITVIGEDKTGIIYKVSKILYEMNVNIEDISQTIMQKYFTMLMLVSIPQDVKIADLAEKLAELKEEGLSIQVQKTDIFDAMHKI